MLTLHYIYSINDSDVINYFYKNDKTIVQRFKPSNLEKYPHLVQYLNTRYTDSESLQETIYRIKNNIEIRPVCKECGSKLKFIKGFPDFCCVSCMAKNKDIQQKKKQTCLAIYGVEYASASKIVQDKVKETNLKRYGVESYARTESERKRLHENNPGASDSAKEKRRKTNLERYGVKNVFANKDIQDKIKHYYIEKYGVENPSQVEEIKEKIKLTNIQRYGFDNPMKSNIIKNKFNFSEIQRKVLETKRKRKTFNTSKAEEIMYKLLIEKYNIVYRQYSSSEYPYCCDFYIPSIDLYIELNAHWTHGGHPFDKNNINDLNKLNYWKNKNTKFYNNAINTWTIRDVEKRNIAKRNNLNYIEFWNLKEVNQFINQKQEN